MKLKELIERLKELEQKGFKDSRVLFSDGHEVLVIDDIFYPHEFIKGINQRSFNIKNFIEYNKFKNGIN